MALPGGETRFIGDGGLETTMIFERGIELPEFASFQLLDDESGRAALRSYYAGYLDLAAAHGVGFTHAELDSAPDLDSGDPDELAGEYRELVAAVPSLSVLGGCCGTDTRHVAAICGACWG
ncbi:MAG TPA: homocysteine S-methyltransferase family protein [Solirubrobacterales bacterium]|nr:homocysteine S-methyltransferase family protein [Solirubrobacterales bacterium]